MTPFAAETTPLGDDSRRNGLAWQMSSLITMWLGVAATIFGGIVAGFSVN